MDGIHIMGPRLHGRIYADPTGASAVADAGYHHQVQFNNLPRSKPKKTRHKPGSQVTL